MSSRTPLWVWYVMVAACLLAGGVLLGVYRWLPVDGASGDLESLTSEGFIVRRVIEQRPGGLRAGDVIVAAGGHTLEEWLAGAVPGDEWRDGGTVHYEVIRGGQRLQLSVPLSPIRPGSLMARWGLQFAIALACLSIGLYVVWRRSDDLAARVLMIFCVLIAVQYVSDAYNIQFSTLAWGWPFWMHVFFEHTVYGLALVAMTCFTLIFPVSHPLMTRRPALVITCLVAAFVLGIAAAMLFAPSWTEAVRWSSHVTWTIAGGEMAIIFAAAYRSARVAADPVSRAQIRWILWCGVLGAAILIPGYVLPLIFTGQPPIPHAIVMLVTALIPFTLAVAILRYRLFDIQVVTNRTLAYALLTSLLAGLYVLLVRTFTLIAEVVWHRGDRSLVIFAATAVVVMAAEPIRRRLQRLIDRVFFRAKVDYQQLLPEMSQRLAAHLDMAEVANLLVGEVVERLQIMHAELDILDPDGIGFHRVRPAGHAEAPSDVEPPSAHHPLARYLWSTELPLLCFQAPANRPPQALSYLAARQAALAIPLITGHKLVGIYYLGLKCSGDGYSGQEVTLLRLLGRQAAVAVENARLFAATQRQAEELSGLHEAAVALSSTLVVEKLWHTLAHHLGRTLRVSHVRVWRLDEEGMGHMLALWHDGRAHTPDAQPCPWPPLLRPILNHEVVICQAPAHDHEGQAQPDTPTAPNPADQATQEAADAWQGLLAVPIVQRGRVIGCAELWETRYARQFGAREVDICRTMSTDAAAAMEQARLFEAERQQRRVTEALQEAADLVSGTLDLDQVLDRILDQVAQVVPGDAFNIMLVEPQGSEPHDANRGEAGGDVTRVVRQRGYKQLGSDHVIDPIVLRVNDFRTLAWMARTGRPTVVPDTSTSPFWHPITGMEWERAYVAAPIRVAGETIGFLNVDSATPGAFTHNDAQQLEVFAHHVATALQNARLYDRAQVELAERRRAEEQLKASLADKEVLLKEIHHRVKNNLQVIASLLYFQARAVTDPAVSAMFQETQMRVRSMALVHERLYTTAGLTRVDAGEYVRTLAGYLFRAYGAGDTHNPQGSHVRFRIETDHVALGVDEAVPCALILHELVANALKHAFPQGKSGEVCVALRSLPDGGIRLTVADNGVGLPHDLEFGNSDAEPHDSSGLGLRLVQHLAMQLDGIVEAHSDPRGGGTRFDVTFAGPESDEDESSLAINLESLEPTLAWQQGAG